MLNRRKQIQKYTKALKNKRMLAENALKNHNLLKHQILLSKREMEDIQNEGEVLKQQNDQKQIIQSQEIEEESEDEKVWNDSEGEQILDQEDIQKNRAKKIIKNIERKKQSATVEKYEKNLGKFYKNKYAMVNWAKQDEDKQELTIEEKDVHDLLNEQVFYSGNASQVKKTQKTVQYLAKTPLKHESIVSGIQWEKNILFTCGYDQKLLVFSSSPNQHNKDQIFNIQKQIYVKNLPLSRCYYQNDKLVMGTLRKNLVMVDTVKWQPKFMTTNFLKELKNYSNLRVSRNKTNIKSALFDGKKVCILDKNMSFIGSMHSNEEITDFSFSANDSNYAYTTSLSAICQWDLRKLQISGVSKQYLNFTTLSESIDQSIIVGSKLGSTYIYSTKGLFGSTSNKDPIENKNILTDITSLSCNRSQTSALTMSKWKSNAARVISLDNGRSLQDWPNTNTKIGYGIVSSWGGNENEEWFSVGSANGVTQTYLLQN